MYVFSMASHGMSLPGWLILPCVFLLAMAFKSAARGGQTDPSSESGREPNRVTEGGEHASQMTQEVDGHQLKFLVQEPAGQRPAEGWPLLLFLHGYGESGTDLQMVKRHGPPKLIDQHPQLKTCLVIAPQCPRQSWWRVRALHALLEQVIAERQDIDRNRLYVTGLSMGGYGSWSLISHYPDFFAAAIPICGGGDPLRLPPGVPASKEGIKNEFDPEGLKRAKHLPVWVFHGTRDASVPLQESELMVELLREAGNDALKFTVYEEAGHVQAWENAYSDPEVWQWLFSQRRSAQR